MTGPPWEARFGKIGFAIDISVSLGSFLLDRNQLGVLQELLRQRAPNWSAGLRVWRERQSKPPVNVEASGALEEAVRERALERGRLFYELEEKYGRGPYDRLFGSAELRGASDTLILVVGVDEYVHAPVGRSWNWGNRVTLQVGRTRVEGMDALKWSREMLQALCERLSPQYGAAYAVQERFTKNISFEAGGVEAIGVDVSRYLPGLYWLNFLGPPYRDLIGRERLLSAPALDTREVDDGILLALHENPRAWDTPAYHETEQAVLDHLGRQFFFDRTNPNRRTVAPDFGLTG